MTRYFLAFFLLATLWAGCKKDDDPDPPVSDEIPVDENTPPVNAVMDSLPYPLLSDYHFFVGNEPSDLIPNEGLLLYEPITQLFTDYAKKSRYVFMPEGMSASYVSDFETFDFPDGTILIKNFYYENVLPENERRVIETRLIYKHNGEWEFADYVWNEAQTDAEFDLSGSNHPLEVVLDNGESVSFNYRVPSQAECMTCHKKLEQASPIGPKPQNLNADLEYQEGIMNQLLKWAETGYLAPTYPDGIATVVDWEDPTQDLKERVRAYLDINCGHCHSDNTHCSYRNIRLGYEDNHREDNLGVCLPPDEVLPGQPMLEYIIDAGNSAESVMWYRMASTEENVRMPLIGKNLIHQEGLDLITEYINSLDSTCP
jgi:uncharacterized repeat protein (TIGR03806 family)